MVWTVLRTCGVLSIVMDPCRPTDFIGEERDDHRVDPPRAAQAHTKPVGEPSKEYDSRTYSYAYGRTDGK